jgi:hypothetical protein
MRFWLRFKQWRNRRYARKLDEKLGNYLFDRINRDAR